MKTIEQKSKAYDEALERAKKELQACGSTDCDAARQIFRLFPELKESEDERIRKEIISFLQLPHPQFVGERKQEKWLTWLEKQGERKPTDKIEIGKKYQCIASPRYSTFRRGEIYKPVDNFLCNLMNLCSDCFEPIEDSEHNPILDFKAKDWYVSKVDGKIHNIYNSVDKVEPKFKTGDWVVTSYGKVNQVITVDKDGDGFTLDDDTYFSGSWKDGYHLWTIKDAKDGDVLASDNSIFIFQEEYIAEKPIAYCGLMNERFLVDGEDACWTNERYYPATKEQRDTLFTKMKEAGYEWDSEKRELKKIEQEELSDFEKSLKHIIEEAIEDGDTHNLKADAELLLGLVQKPSDEEMKELLRTEYEKGRADVFAQMQKEWSEEDELQMQGIIDLLPGLTIRHNWLKCIKQRLIWKPSDEQMHYLANVKLGDNVVEQEVSKTP